MSQLRIRIAELVNGFAVEGPGGGASRFGISLSKSLDDSRFQSYTIGLWNFGMPFEEERVIALNKSDNPAYTASDWQVNNPYRSFWAAYQNLKIFFSQNPVDILHSHSEFGDIAALILKIYHRQLILIRTVHNGYQIEWRKRPLRRWALTNFLYPILFYAEIGVNQPIVDRLDRRWMARLLKKKAVKFPNAVDLTRFDKTKNSGVKFRECLSLPEDAFVIGTVGRLAIEKGIEYLLQAAKMVLPKIPNAYFVIVGDGELLSALEKNAIDLGISNNVRFTGSRSDIEAIYACFNILASSSLWEGLSTVILEGLAAGVPIIATDIPGNKEILVHNWNCYLVPPAQPELLADAIHELYIQPNLTNKLIANGLETVRAFRIETITKEHEVLYEKVYRDKN